MSTSYLCIPVLESLALSSSSSSSSSFLSTDLQSDCSPPHSPIQDVQIFDPTYQDTEGKLQARMLSFIDVDPDATPKLPPPKQDHGWFKFGSDDDNGYESECEGYTNLAVGPRTRLRTRKRGSTLRQTGLGLIAPSSLDGRFNFADHVEEALPVRSSTIIHASPRGLLHSPDGEARIDQLVPTQASFHPPPKPQILPVSDASSPSPIFPLPELLLRPGLHRLSGLPRKPRLQALMLPDQISPMDDLPPAADYLSLGHKPGEDVPFLALVSVSFSDHEDAMDQLGFGSPLESSRISELYAAKETVLTAVPVCGNALGTKKPTGLGLGLPSSLDHGNRTHIDRTPPLDSSVLLDTPSRPTAPTSPQKASAWSTPNRRLGGIVSGVRRLFKANQYSKRHLYDIPESISPIAVHASSRGKPHCVPSAVPKTMGTATPRPKNPRSSTFPSRDSLNLVASWKMLPRLGDSPRKLWIWPGKSSGSPPAPRTSPATVIHEDVLQDLNLTKHRRSLF
ncbi:hypothetical protein Hypma_006320 [Hypsizygus marmoreus]|uniref:Uncharacterized protein n=1 Tax=Hypsizygus marmoreus TaxID=39966 RepID=A0A369JYP9_HYPMA|nr:hypothetical protein Hypma_006320 [Hypsizygus marmoreus]